MSARTYRVTIGERTFELVVTRDEGRTTVAIDGGAPELAALTAPNEVGVRRLALAGRSVDLMLGRSAERTLVALPGVELDLTVTDERAARLAQFGGRSGPAAGNQVIAAPMPGLVVRVNAQVGQAVKEGESLVVLQAMKMENELGSPRDGVVKAVTVEPGVAVDQGQVLVELE